MARRFFCDKPTSDEACMAVDIIAIVYSRRMNGSTVTTRAAITTTARLFTDAVSRRAAAAPSPSSSFFSSRASRRPRTVCCCSRIGTPFPSGSSSGSRRSEPSALLRRVPAVRQRLETTAAAIRCYYFSSRGNISHRGSVGSFRKFSTSSLPHGAAAGTAVSTACGNDNSSNNKNNNYHSSVGSVRYLAASSAPPDGAAGTAAVSSSSSSSTSAAVDPTEDDEEKDPSGTDPQTSRKSDSSSSSSSSSNMSSSSNILSRLALSGSPSREALERALRLQPDAPWDRVVAARGSHSKGVLDLHDDDDTHGDHSDPYSDVADAVYDNDDSTTDSDDDDDEYLRNNSVEGNEPLAMRYTTPASRGDSPAEQPQWDELRYRIQSTQQLIETPLAQWTTEDWFGAETACKSVWSAQPCVRAVVLQFALLHRSLLEQEALRLRSSSSSQHQQYAHHHHPPGSNNNNNSPSLSPSPSLDKWIGLTLLNRMLSNWRLVYTGWRARELAQSCHLAPHHLLETVVADYHDRFNAHLSEWTMYLLLDADLRVWRPETPQFSQEILDTCIELYQTGDPMCKPKPQLFNCVLQSWIPAAGSNTAAVAAVGEVFDCLAEHQIPPNGRTYKYALRIWCQQGTPDAALEAESLLQRMYAEFLAGTRATKPDVHAFTLVAVAWARSGSPAAGQRCEEIYRQMELLRAKGHVFGLDDISVINNALLAYSKSQTLEALQHSEQFWRSTGVAGNYTTYTNLIKQYAHLGRIRDVDRLIKESQASSTTTTVRVDMATYVLVFKAYSESALRDKVEHANELLEFLERDPQIAAKLNTRVYNAYLSVVSRDRLGYNSGEIAERSLLKMIEAGKSNPAVRPDAVTYSTVMNAWARAGQPDRAAKVLRRMYDDYCLGGNKAAKPDLQSFNTVMKAYTQSVYDDEAKAEAFFHSMRSLAGKGDLDIEPDTFTYAALMSCLAKTKDMGKRTQQAQKVEEVLHYMKTQYEIGASKVRPNVYCYNKAIDAWARASNASKAEEVFLEMCEDYKKGNESAKPQTVTFNILMKAWAFSKRPEAAARAEQILQQMHDVTQSGAMHVPPDIKTYTSLVMCLGFSKIPGAPQRAEEIVRHVDCLHQSGHLEEGPSRQTFETLIKAWKYSNEVDKMENVERLKTEMNERFSKKARSPRQKARTR